MGLSPTRLSAVLLVATLSIAIGGVPFGAGSTLACCLNGRSVHCAAPSSVSTACCVPVQQPPVAPNGPQAAPDAPLAPAFAPTPAPALVPVSASFTLPASLRGSPPDLPTLYAALLI
jgi:hypothetical protein